MRHRLELGRGAHSGRNATRSTRCVQHVPGPPPPGMTRFDKPATGGTELRPPSGFLGELGDRLRQGSRVARRHQHRGARVDHFRHTGQLCRDHRKPGRQVLEELQRREVRRGVGGVRRQPDLRAGQQLGISS